MPAKIPTSNAANTMMTYNMGASNGMERSRNESSLKRGSNK